MCGIRNSHARHIWYLDTCQEHATLTCQAHTVPLYMPGTCYLNTRQAPTILTCARHTLPSHIPGTCYLHTLQATLPSHVPSTHATAELPLCPSGRPVDSPVGVFCPTDTICFVVIGTRALCLTLVLPRLPTHTESWWPVLGRAAWPWHLFQLWCA